MKLVMVNHGQSFTEQGFSINKLTSDVNMEEELLIAQRVIYSAMNSADTNAGNFLITKKMRQSCKKACQRQKLAHESTKSDAQKSEKEQKRKLKNQEVKEMKRQKLDLEQPIKTLKKSLYEEAIASAQQNRWDYATKAASFAQTLKEKEVLYDKLCGFEEKLQNIKLCWIDNVWLEFMDKVSLFFTVAFQFILLVSFLCNWMNSLSLLSFVKVCFNYHIESRSQKLETYTIFFFNYTVEK